jgi:hypothetical protein
MRARAERTYGEAKIRTRLVFRVTSRVAVVGALICISYVCIAAGAQQSSAGTSPPST